MKRVELKNMPGTITKPKDKTQVETKEEPRVIADVALGRIIQEWTAKEKECGSIYIKMIDFVRENETSSQILQQTLVNIVI